jgi:SAM-dependent methyltransferase
MSTNVFAQFRPSPVPRSATPSHFVASCLGALPPNCQGIAADLGCGYGRHSRLLASLGFTVLAFDLDIRALKTLNASLTLPSGGAQGKIYPLIANVEADLPVKAASLNLAVVVHCSIHKHLGPIKDALAPGGWLIYETFGGQGMNWLDLPKAGQLRRKLAPRFEFLVLDERHVGPKEKRSVVVRLFARKR